HEAANTTNLVEEDERLNSLALAEVVLKGKAVWRLMIFEEPVVEQTLSRLRGPKVSVRTPRIDLRANGVHEVRVLAWGSSFRDCVRIAGSLDLFRQVLRHLI